MSFGFIVLFFATSASFIPCAGQNRNTMESVCLLSFVFHHAMSERVVSFDGAVRTAIADLHSSNEEKDHPLAYFIFLDSSSSPKAELYAYSPRPLYIKDSASHFWDSTRIQQMHPLLTPHDPRTTKNTSVCSHLCTFSHHQQPECMHTHLTFSIF